MIVQIAVLILLTVVYVALFLVPRHVEARVIFQDTADLPRPFGPDMAWLAIKSIDTDAVRSALGLHETIPANWNSGIGAIYDGALGDRYVFVSPPIDGWTLVAGVPLPLPAGKAFADKLTPLIANLARAFPDVQFFATFPSADFFGWARITNGKWVRAFAASEEGAVWNRGKLTPEEKALGLKLFEVRGIKGRMGDIGGPLILHPTEEQVLRLAGAWGINPAEIAMQKNISPATGTMAVAPASWRAELLRKAAA